MTDYTDPSTVDVDVVMGNITGDYEVRGHLWTDKPSWPNVTVKALTDEIQRLRAGEGTTQPAPDDPSPVSGDVLPPAEVRRIRSVSGGNAVTQRLADSHEALRELVGQHDPTGADHMAEMWEHAQRADSAETERDTLRTENGRLRTALRLSEVALADWERSYPNLTGDPTQDAIAVVQAINGRASGEGTAPQVPAEVLAAGTTIHVGPTYDPSTTHSRVIGQNVAVPPGTPYRVVAADGAPQPAPVVISSTSPLCVCLHEHRHHTGFRGSEGCSWQDCVCEGFIAYPSDGAPQPEADDRG